jgi:hypothetical protein
MITVVVLAGMIMAADAPKAQIPTFERAVNICTAEVQKAFPYGKFDTYLIGTNEVRWIGTQQEQFRFEKCMSQKGRAHGHGDAPQRQAGGNEARDQLLEHLVRLLRRTRAVDQPGDRFGDLRLAHWTTLPPATHSAGVVGSRRESGRREVFGESLRRSPRDGQDETRSPEVPGRASVSGSSCRRCTPGPGARPVRRCKHASSSGGPERSVPIGWPSFNG